MTSHLGILVMRVLAVLPLPVLRALGAMLGGLVYLVVVPRRRVVRVNLNTCFPGLSAVQRERRVLAVFVRFAQAWLDRSWLWHAPAERVRQRLSLQGAIGELHGQDATVLFAPHFVGLDAGWTALALLLPRRLTTIYTDQSNRVLNAWILRGRQRFGQVRVFGRAEGVRGIVDALRQGEPLYLLPDMNFGPEESIFAPFYGVPAATVPSLSRFARLGRAKVVPLLTRMTSAGYEVEVLPAWTEFPTADAQADTERMNRELQAYIDRMPDQYYWVHKRFKTRPPGAAPIY